VSIPSDLEIARASKVRPIGEIAENMGLPEHLWEPYGRDIGKISLDAIEDLVRRSTHVP